MQPAASTIESTHGRSFRHGQNEREGRLIRRRNLQEIREQVARPDGKRLCQLDDVLQCDVPFAALNSADVVAMQSGALG